MARTAIEVKADLVEKGAGSSPRWAARRAIS